MIDRQTSQHFQPTNRPIIFLFFASYIPSWWQVDCQLHVWRVWIVRRNIHHISTHSTCYQRVVVSLWCRLYNIHITVNIRRFQLMEHIIKLSKFLCDIFLQSRSVFLIIISWKSRISSFKSHNIFLFIIAQSSR